MIKEVIFDLNGVFLESPKLSDRFSLDYGVDKDEFLGALKQIMDQVRQPNAPATFSLWQPYLNKWGLKLSEKEFYDYWFSGEHLVPELLDFARELKTKGLRMSILSNNFRERTTYYRDHFPELFSEFDGVYFSWETGFVKSQPEAYENVLKRQNLTADECIFFDDSPKNVELAQSLGIKSQVYGGLETTKKFIDLNL